MRERQSRGVDAIQKQVRQRIVSWGDLFLLRGKGFALAKIIVAFVWRHFFCAALSITSQIEFTKMRQRPPFWF
jgi:hypothetical protein